MVAVCFWVCHLHLRKLQVLMFPWNHKNNIMFGEFISLLQPSAPRRMLQLQIPLPLSQQARSADPYHRLSVPSSMFNSKVNSLKFWTHLKSKALLTDSFLRLLSTWETPESELLPWTVLKVSSEDRVLLTPEVLSPFQSDLVLSDVSWTLLVKDSKY